MIHNRRWGIFAALAFIYILVYFYRVSLAVVAGDISRELNLSPADLGRLSGILFYVYAVTQLPLGPMIDRLGGRLVISISGVVTTLGGWLFASADSLAMAMTARVLIGIGTASVLMATFTIFSRWFTKQEFGRVSGLMVAAGNVGNLFATVPLAVAVGMVGWRSSFFFIAVAQGVATLLVYVTVRDAPSMEALQRADSEAKTGIFAAWKEIFTDKDFLRLGLISFFWYGNYLAVQGLWGGPYLMKIIGLSRTETGTMLMFTSIGFIVGSIFVDSVARRFFRSFKKTLLILLIMLMLLMSGFLGWGEVIPRGLMQLWFFLIGITVSGGIMIYPIIRHNFRVSIVGTALTSLNFFVLMGAAVTQHLMGVIIERMSSGNELTSHAFRLAFMMPLSGLFFAIIIYLFARDTKA